MSSRGWIAAAGVMLLGLGIMAGEHLDAAQSNDAEAERADIQAQGAQIREQRQALEARRQSLEAEVSKMRESRLRILAELQAQIAELSAEQEAIRERLQERVERIESGSVMSDREFELLHITRVQLPALAVREGRLEAREMALDGKRERAALAWAEAQVDDAEIRELEAEMFLDQARDKLRQAQRSLEHIEGIEVGGGIIPGSPERAVERHGFAAVSVREHEARLEKNRVWTEQARIALEVARQGGSSGAAQEQALAELEERLERIEDEEARLAIERGRVVAMRSDRFDRMGAVQGVSKPPQPLTEAEVAEQVQSLVDYCLSEAEDVLIECEACRDALSRHIESSVDRMKECRSQGRFPDASCLDSLQGSFRSCGRPPPAAYREPLLAIDVGFEENLSRRFGCGDTAVATDEAQTAAVEIRLPGLLERARASDSHHHEELRVDSGQVEVRLSRGRFVGRQCSDLAMIPPYDSWTREIWSGIAGTVRVEVLERPEAGWYATPVRTRIELLDIVFERGDSSGESVRIDSMAMEVGLQWVAPLAAPVSPGA